MFPTLLERIDHPELGSLFARYVREPRAWLPRSLAPRPARVRDDTAAEDWASLDQRMRFILELFRSRQQNRRLLEPTFSVAQVHAMKQGRVPDGPLT